QARSLPTTSRFRRRIWGFDRESPLPACGERSDCEAIRVRGTLRERNSWRLPLTPTLSPRAAFLNSSLAQLSTTDQSGHKRGGGGRSPPTTVPSGSTISNLRGNSSISPISSASRIGLPPTLTFPAPTASGKLVCLAITSSSVERASVTLAS